MAKEKNIDAINFKHDDWLTLQNNYLTQDSQIRSIPSLVVHSILVEHGLLDLTGKKIIVVGNDTVNADSVYSYLKSIHPDSSLVAKFESLRSQNSSDIIAGHFLENSQIIVTCLNQPEAVHLDKLPSLELAIDFGYGTKDGSVKGDCLYNLSNSQSAALVTCVPAGVGAILGAFIARNLYVSWKNNLVRTFNSDCN